MVSLQRTSLNLMTISWYFIQNYSSEAPKDNIDMDDFHRLLPTCQVKVVEQSEISDAIMAMQNGKASGPDGYPIEFFKQVSLKLTPLLLDVFVDSQANGALHRTLTEESNSLYTGLLLKPGKDKGMWVISPYFAAQLRHKNISKSTGMTSGNVMAEVISPEQTGFMTGHHSYSNLSSFTHHTFPSVQWGGRSDYFSGCRKSI